MTDKKLTELDASTTVDFIYGELSGVSKKIISANVVAQGNPSIAASKLLGRGSAGGAGAAEEITVGSGLNLTGTTLTSTTLGPYIIPADYGVVADNTTDDTAALNAMFATLAGTSAIVLWPKTNFCKTSDTVLVGVPGAGGHSQISLMGVGSNEICGINYTGPTDRSILRFSKNTSFFVQDMRVQNNAGSTGTTVGVELGSNGIDTGNQTANFFFQRFSVFRCNIGIQAGGHAGAASEGTFSQCSMAENDTGFIAIDFNSLDFNFLMTSMGFNGVGIDVGAGGGINVFGGSSSGNGVSFSCGTGISEIISYRSEDETLFLDGGAGSGKVTLRSCSVSNPLAPGVAISGKFLRLDIDNCLLVGKVVIDEIPTLLKMTGNQLGDWDTAHGLPLFLTDTRSQIAPKVEFLNNLDISVFPPIPIPDLIGQIGARYDGATTNPFYEPTISQFPVDLRTSAPTIGAPYLALSHVRQLSEGTIPGATANTAPTPGQNLRVTGKFASAATFSLLFKRTNVVVTPAGSPLLTATSGIFFPTDVGKPIKITAGFFAGGDCYGYITDYIDSTHVNMFPFTNFPDGTPGKATVIGADEPDAFYLVAGLCGNANETFWIDTIAATGFTMHSSNATSAATLVALIVR